jgi:predicted PurR-regulated permease PerM
VCSSDLSPLFFFALLIWILYEAARVLQPFFGPIVLAVAVGTVFHPMRRRLAAWWPGLSEAVLALICDALVAIFIVVPVLLMVWGVATEVGELMPVLRRWGSQASAWLQGSSEHSWLRHLPESVRQQFDGQDNLSEIINRVLQELGRAAPSLAANAVRVFIDVVVFLLTLYFVFRHGEVFLGRLFDLIPLSRANREAIKEKLRTANKAVIRGTFLTSLLQGLSACVGFLIAGTKAAFLLGLATAVTTLVPGVGSPAVWLPVCIYYVAQGAYGKAAFLAVWGILVVGVVDNFIRPMLVGTKATVPFIWLFFGLLGGMEAFGPAGFILGPVILTLTPLLLEIYQREYLSGKNYD